MSSVSVYCNAPFLDVPQAVLSLDIVLASTLCFTITVLGVGLWTHHRGPIPGAAWTMRWHNGVYATTSILMLGLIVQHSVAVVTCGQVGGLADILRIKAKVKVEMADSQMTTIALAPFLYHCSKFYEYLDILFVLANHGPRYGSSSQQPIGLHFAFHHLTTPYLTWFRIIQSSGPGWEVFAGLNCMHHGLMYLFFAGGLKDLGLKAERLRKMLPWTGGFQLVSGVAMEVWALPLNGKETAAESFSVDLWGHLVALCLLSTYLCLFVRDLRQRADGRAVQTQEKLD